ncbi:MAG TPA: helix-turn-helix domain-containing protein [Phycisphaerae bacterium]|nr:helix-turn-helix domain-containing protein [Phycisphaerae bacterium]
MNLGKLIRRRREQLHLTQDQIAAKAGISKPYLSNIETGKTKNPPTDGILRALERVLQFESSELTRLAHLARTPADVRQEHEMLALELNKLRDVVKELLSVGTSEGAGGLDLDSLAEKLSAEGNVRHLSAGSVVPIINNVAAGYPQNFTDLDYPPSVADEYIRCPDLDDEQSFAARVVGDSMEPKYHEGDVVVFSPNTPAQGGDDCFVRFDADGGTTFKRFYQDDESTIRLQPLNSAYPGQSYQREQITGLWPAVFRIERLRRS